MRNKNFLALLFTRIFSNMGDSIFYILSMWFIFDVTGSSLYVGIAGALFTIPPILSFFLGPIIDNNNPKKLYILFSTVQVILLLIFVWIVSAENFYLAFFFVILFLIATLSESTYPLEHVLIPQVVQKKDLVKANSVMSIAYQGLDFLFNGLAGILIAFLTVTYLYGLNAVLFLLPIFTILMIKIHYPVKKRSAVREGFVQYKQDVKSGLAFVMHPLILRLLLPLVAVNFLFAIVLVTLPEFADHINGGPTMYGIILAGLGAGSIIGALIAENIQRKWRLGILLPAGFFFSGISWFVMVFMAQFSLVLLFVFLVLSYIFVGIINVLFTTLFQTLPETNMLGRVNTTVESVISISMPLGSLLGGYIATLLPISYVIVLFGVGLVLLSIYYLCSSKVRNLPKVLELRLEAIEKVSK
ncbi:MFS transporter [Shouchella miscanthi]|uniref:MFS transporter n=1 Tax=Shouchella miscanthi TaxID=2598861 RepID=A0ABU6NRB9_9BACI|nr:MFS transporter [Shouchella miscanthi]MED4130728.1 MFS transporter [Shouchella miscanthi]